MNRITKKLLDECSAVGYTRIKITGETLFQVIASRNRPPVPRIEDKPAIWVILDKLHKTWGCGYGEDDHHVSQYKPGSLTPGDFKYSAKTKQWKEKT